MWNMPEENETACESDFKWWCSFCSDCLLNLRLQAWYANTVKSVQLPIETYLGYKTQGETLQTTLTNSFSSPQNR